ncbi:MAG: DeoR/GlpR family DNA-binding transcription regulator [Anaerocolumna sp.]
MNRYDQIIQLLKTNGYLNVNELCIQLKVSPATIRRDLHVMEQNSLIKRVSGGAILIQSSAQGYTNPSDKFINEKKRIAKKAVSYIEPGMTLFIDSGSTNHEIAKLLLDIPNIFVITNSIHIAYLLISNERGNSVFVCGGSISEGKETGIVGVMAEMAVSYFRADLFLMGVSNVNINHGITDPYIPASNIKKKMIDYSTQVFLVADHSKFGTMSKAFVAEIDTVDRIITDDLLSESELKLIRQKGIPIDLV